MERTKPRGLIESRCPMLLGSAVLTLFEMDTAHANAVDTQARVQGMARRYG
ncbi:hypothetical protein [Tateyamaria sp. syn59]|uniref:hypothetical protein n=1 Tax=Tateyamaria sp. syn59 TaxID=2576942 RepID=UPI001678BCA6|nr:hypothetical protein [Tateyamaria sp. syn59]